MISNNLIFNEWAFLGQEIWKYKLFNPLLLKALFRSGDAAVGS